ncbi:SDR family NAD(P)-dependent oxidoreductase [Roseomonas sp. AR75]|uniref:SDR family NAD(P)-dependent oxidoreductase n=1 Tax=Roseomonas sp. AR75 TaxID=2562311 RepID=UPI0010BF67CF|nr:SDR family NAD(P)-dependent oxidoreductase [Roseomonas sp. AR75]
MNIRFDGKLVAISGGAVGFGRAIARRFHALGARVFTCDVDAAGLAETATGTGIATAVVDLADRAAATAWIGAVEEAGGGPLDILVHNAGGTLGRAFHRIEEMPDGDWDAIVAVNLNAAFALCRAAAGGMRKAGRGRIITISSGAGLQPSRTGIQAYTAAKHALVGLTRQLAVELGPHGITVNSVAPGVQASTPEKVAEWNARAPEAREAVLRTIMLRRLGEPDDIADGVLFLASDHAKLITGHVLPVNGGRI